MPTGPIQIPIGSIGYRSREATSMADVNRYRSLDMRYFFHAVGTKCIHEDENGEEFDNDEDAAAYGAVIANELSDGGILSMMYILVVDEEDKEVSRSPISSCKSIH